MYFTINFKKDPDFKKRGAQNTLIKSMEFKKREIRELFV